MCNIIDPRLLVNNLSPLPSSTVVKTPQSMRMSSNSSHIHNGSQEGSSDSWNEIRVPVPWGHIAGKTYGNPNGHPVLAVHGWMDNAGTFDRLVPLLSKSLYIVAVDLPGHGLSTHLPTGMPYHYTDFLIALRRITNYLKWSKFSWIGHSMGAGLGSLYASTFPTHVNKFNSKIGVISNSSKDTKDKLKIESKNESPQVERLVMLDLVKPITGESGTDYATKISLAVDQFLALEEKITPTPPAYTYESALERLIKGTGDALTLESAKALMIRGAVEVGDGKVSFRRDLRLRSPSILRFSHEQCFNILSQLHSPTLILKASNSPWYDAKEVCEETIELYKKNCSLFKFIEVEGNHFVHLNEPEKCSDSINQFLAETKALL